MKQVLYLASENLKAILQTINDPRIAHSPARRHEACYRVRLWCDHVVGRATQAVLAHHSDAHDAGSQDCRCAGDVRAPPKSGFVRSRRL